MSNGDRVANVSPGLPLSARFRLLAFRWSRTLLYTVRAHRRVVSLTAFAVVAALSYAASYWARFDFSWPHQYDRVFWTTLGPLLILRIAAAYACGLDTHRWRWVGARDVRRLAVAVAAGTVPFAFIVFVLLDPTPPVPRSMLLLEPMSTVLLSAGLWLGYRTLYEMVSGSDTRQGPARRVLVVGAGEAGEALVRQMLAHPGTYRPVAFVDDSRKRQGTSVHGVKVLGGTKDLTAIAAKCKAEEIVIAVPSAVPATLHSIVGRCEPTGLPFRVLPHIAEVLDGDVSLSQLRDVQIDDLLGREPVSLELPELTRELASKTVLITGAAGSIGSELARQVARNRPAGLLLLDQSETGLFFLEIELKELGLDLEITCIVGDVVDPAAVEHAFRAYQPDWVFHAAAYKHVPMMEANEREALRNNIIGSWRVAEAAGRHGVDKFVLVSTDKAVRPANVMGATKRAAEIVILELQTKFPRTAFGAVRFGNVLGSAGSVVPVFKRLLEAGKPLTVTHKDITRYFMTIPEAAQLVLQASLLPGLRGRVAMLDMGQPIRIVDLARTLIRLSGGGRGQEPIVFTGLRPGEKLHEELVAPDEKSYPTSVAKVNLLEPKDDVLRHRLLARLSMWDRLLAAWNPEPVMLELLKVVPELRHCRADRPAYILAPVQPMVSTQSIAGSARRRRSRTRPARHRLSPPTREDRRHPSNLPSDLSRVPRRRATDPFDSSELWAYTSP